MTIRQTSSAVGLSIGGGMAGQFGASDFRAYGSCSAVLMGAVVLAAVWSLFEIHVPAAASALAAAVSAWPAA